MRNITLSADETLIDGARQRAASENTTLNSLFREWLARYAGEARLTATDIRAAIVDAGDFRVGRRLTREERNER